MASTKGDKLDRFKAKRFETRILSPKVVLISHFHKQQLKRGHRTYRFSACSFMKQKEVKLVLFGGIGRRPLCLVHNLSKNQKHTTAGIR
jgi:hypothetical protein